MKWFRFYNEVLHDSKVQTLPAESYRTWTNLLCVASENRPRGTLPDLRQVAFLLRMKEERVRPILDDFVALGLLERDTSGTLRPHNWAVRQPESDDAAARMRESRRRRKPDPSSNGHDAEPVIERVAQQVHPSYCRARPDSDPDTETEQAPLPPVSGGAGGAGGGGDISTFEELLIRVEADFRRPDWTAAVSASEASIVGKVDRLDCFLAGLRQAERSRTEIHDLIAFAIDRARAYQRSGIPPEPIRVEPKTGKPADRGAAPPPPGKAESANCRHCSGEGQVRVFHPEPDPARRIPASTAADCVCPRGRAMRSSRAAADNRRIVDLADVLAGRGPWRLEQSQESAT